MNSRAETSWSPGQSVRLFGPRVRVHTLTERDLDDSINVWTGSAERNEFVWKPNMSIRDYMLGLIQHCDNVSRFIFGIRDGETNKLIGYRKVQLTTEDNGRGAELTAVPTTVIGDRWAGQAYGQESGALVNWFLLRAVQVRAVSPRIYDANDKTWHLAEKLGYRLVRRTEESSARGSLIVRHYTITAEELEPRWSDLFANFRMEAAARQ